MKFALCIWNGRLAPVFDCAGTLLLIDGTSRCEYRIGALDLVERARFLSEKGVQTLICGALSREAQIILTHEGIQLFPFRSGNIDEVIQAFEEKTLDKADWAMPGCSCQKRRRAAQTHQGGEGGHCNRKHTRRCT